MGFPPTTSKVSGDTNNVTTFNYQFPNFTGTHTGTTVALGVNSLAGGGTNNGSLAATAGGVIYTDGSKLVNVGAGTSGQVLQSNGASAPTWANTVATSAVSYTGQTTGSWSTSSTTYADFGSATDTLTQVTNSGFGTVTALTNLPGITFTPAKLGRYFISANPHLQTSGTAIGAARLIDSNSFVIAEGSLAGASQVETVVPLTGIFNIASLTSYTLKIQGKTNTATLSLYSALSVAVSWTIHSLD